MIDDSSSIPEKSCSKCGKPFPLTSQFFQPNKSKKGGFESQCKICQSEHAKQHYEQNKAQVREQQKVYRETHREQRLEQKKQYYEAHRDQDNARRRAYRLAHLEQEREHAKQHRDANKEIMRERRKRSRESHKEQIAKRMKQWQQGESYRAYQKRYHQEHREEISKQSRQNYLAHQKERLEKQRRYLQTERGRMVGKAHRHKRRALKRASKGSYTTQQLQEQFQRQKGKCYWCKVKLGKMWHADHVIPLAKGGSNTIDNIVAACPTCNMRRKDKLPHEWPEGGRLL